MNTTSVFQMAISLACWAFSFGLLQLLLSSIFLILILWLVYGASLSRSVIWTITNALFSLTPFILLGFTLIYFDIKWLPDKLNGITTYSPMLPALTYALFLMLLGMIFHVIVLTGPKRRNSLMLVALIAAYFFGAILRARIIGAL